MCYYFSKQKFLNPLVWLDHSDSEAFKYCSKAQEGGISTMNAQCTTLIPVMKIIGNVRSLQIHTSPPSPFPTSLFSLCLCSNTSWVQTMTSRQKRYCDPLSPCTHSVSHYVYSEDGPTYLWLLMTCCRSGSCMSDVRARDNATYSVYMSPALNRNS